jgi:hypothetical protein
MTTDNFCFNLQNRIIQTSQSGGQQYSDTSPFSIPCMIVSPVGHVGGALVAGAGVVVGLEEPAQGL